MSLQKLKPGLSAALAELEAAGTMKGRETVITAVLPAAGGRGPRYTVAGEGDKPYLRMNANNYLGMSGRPEVIAAEEAAASRFGAGPGAVRFISGTYSPHVELEQALAAFHRRQAAMIFSSAYAAVMGVLAPLISPETVVISDELNHNCIINAVALSRPLAKQVYRHNDMQSLEAALEAAAREAGTRRALIVTDGIFSMRGDHAPLKKIAGLAEKYDPAFAEGVLTVVDDSHGVGAFGASGRGTLEYTGEGRIDVLIATLGKALGVNGGYVASDGEVIAYLREKAPFYIYSNPITCSEAAAAREALRILDSPEGIGLLKHLRAMTARFEAGLIELGFEVIRGEHPVVPLIVRDTPRTRALAAYLKEEGILATGLSFPVVPRGQEEIRFQICADHTEADIDYALGVLRGYLKSGSS
jgi:glycine C-acetyltransferase